MAIQYPELSFRFSIDWGGTRIGATEIDGLTNFSTEAVKYREGSFAADHDLIRPGRRTYGDGKVTVKRGIMRNDPEFLEWLNTNNHGVVERRTITISLLDENQDPAVVWTLSEAWPGKLDGSQLNSTSNEHFMETLEINYETIIQQFPVA